MKKIIIIILTVILLTGCTNKTEKLYLSDEYYNNGSFITYTSEDLSSLKDKTYLLYTYNNYCSLPVSCEEIFKSFMEKYKIDIVQIPYAEFKKTKFYSTVKYAPSILIMQNDKVISYLDPNKDEDLPKYQDKSKFENYLKEHIYFTKEN